MTEESRKILSRLVYESPDEEAAAVLAALARIAELEVEIVHLKSDVASARSEREQILAERDGALADLESRPAPAAINPETPRRFRWFSPGLRMLRYGVYFPREDRQVDDRGCMESEMPRSGDVQWIDPAPGAKGAGDGDLETKSNPD